MGLVGSQALTIVDCGPRYSTLLKFTLRLFWHPLACCGVVSIPRRACQGFLGGIHDQVVLAIFLAHLQRIERDAHILPAEAEKTANAQYHGLDLTILVQEEVTDFADGVIG